MIGRNGLTIMGQVENWTSLRVLVLTGEYTLPWSVIGVLTLLHSLESLVIDATWKDIDYPPNGVNQELSTRLRAVALSGPSLIFLRWMCSVHPDFGPAELHLCRLKFDTRYGSGIAHLSVWFEECPELVYEELGKALSHTPHLYQLSLFFPTELFRRIFHESIDAVCSRRRPPLVKGWDAYQINNESDFWLEPSTGCGRVEAHVVVVEEP
ncbi:hypothetical protein NMY22_g9710 [Coprinellus aureogranulatus]|nr:hypothetical protein NMY22_g9710 [Coprinellus aureogranulatus]